MHERYDLLGESEILDPVWIPMSDGARLAARIILPRSASQRPVPAVLEYLPYRRGDGTAQRDALRHPFLAGHGIAAVRVDMRGSGDSDGVLYDEYLLQEQLDACEVIAWLATQPWCNGNVGMFGISWGGFNALQVAAMQPPALKAIITVCSTDDRYADDVHYMGGCLLAVDMLPWASVMLAYNARSPDPHMVGDQWRELWQTRLEDTPPYIETWLAHQRRDAFWQHGSVCEDFSRIKCPVYAVGGWADGYTNAVLRLLDGLTVPRKGLIGPWAHKYPEAGRPGPAIGFQAEAVKWWQHWLTDEPNDIMDGPMLTSYIQDWMPPASWYAHRDGRWVADATWPSADPALRFYGGTGQLQTEADVQMHVAPVVIGTTLRSGADAGMWCSYALPGDYPPDQRAEDGRSWTIDSAPATAAYDILGFPECSFEVAVDQPWAQVVVRLCDVAPDGQSLLVSRGLLNLTHRHGHDRVVDMIPGQPERIRVRLNAAGHHLRAGHRWRIAIAPAYWPHAWPSPTLTTLQIDPASLWLDVPVRPAHPGDASADVFAPPAGTPVVGMTVRRPEQRARYERFDQVTSTWQLHDENDHGAFERSDGWCYDHRAADRYFITEGDPLSARSVCEHAITISRHDWHTNVETYSELTCDATHFHVTNTVKAYAQHELIFQSTRSKSVRRDGV